MRNRCQTVQMRAAVRHTYGGPVAIEQVDPPQIADDEVLVEVRAAGLDRGVLHLWEGTPYALRLVFGLRRPKNPVLGLDVAGRVAEVGSAVSGFAVGDEVCGIARGSFAELAAELSDNGHKALVFSQFVDHLKILEKQLKAKKISYQYLDGATPAAERSRRVAAFQAGEGDLFLISLKAGGFGLNLTAADYVVITDPWWNPAVEQQELPVGGSGGLLTDDAAQGNPGVVVDLPQPGQPG